MVEPVREVRVVEVVEGGKGVRGAHWHWPGHWHWQGQGQGGLTSAVVVEDPCLVWVFEVALEVVLFPELLDVGGPGIVQELPVGLGFGGFCFGFREPVVELVAHVDELLPVVVAEVVVEGVRPGAGVMSLVLGARALRVDHPCSMTSPQVLPDPGW